MIRDGLQNSATPWIRKAAPKAEAKVAVVEEKVRPEVQDAIDFLVSADSLDAVATTRGSRPDPNKGFGAQRFGVTATKGENELLCIFQTESKVGHGQWVVPGETQVDGWVGLTSNLYGQPELILNGAEVKALQNAAAQEARNGKNPVQPSLASIGAWSKAIYLNGDSSKSL